MDNRIALKKGYKIAGSDGKTIEIKSEVGRGASCIVYDAEYKDSLGIKHNIRMKECYPIYFQIERMSNGQIKLQDHNLDKFELTIQSFEQSYRTNINIRNTLGLTNSTINSSDIIKSNNTCYIIMSLDEGCDYRKYEDKSLIELFLHIKSVAKLIQKYHDNGYLHLDIKPENILILPETEEHILLFDFDSVIKKSDLKENIKIELSFSQGFSAPEQIQGMIHKIDYYTDIYSIGAVLFYKLFGRKVNLDECKISSDYELKEMKYSSEKYQPGFYKILEKFFRKTLSVSVIPRWNDMQLVIDCLDELIDLADIDSIYLMDNFQYNSACFIGREFELEQISKKLQENQVIFLSGIGGIGKSELAKQYAKRNRDFYHTIVFSIFDNNIESLVNNEIYINHLEKDKDESETDYFERKIDVLKKIVTDKDLIIIDNFDVDFDVNLEKLFSCPCKFIVTSRMDFRDYNYEQIYIDRIDDVYDILNLFYTYNDKMYGKEEETAVERLLEYVDYHTMMVELISKYLSVSEDSPVELLCRFMEKTGTVNTLEVDVKQRKDRKLRLETVNNHLSILFDVSNFDTVEREIIGSLSLYAGIRMKKMKFEKLCEISHVSEKLNKLIQRGWIEYNEYDDKISLHQIILDLIYNNLKPCGENCPHIVTGMSKYYLMNTENYTESRIKQRLFDIFMNRITGENTSYARLCMIYGTKAKLAEAEQICLNDKQKESYDILQHIYRKQIGIIADCEDMFEEALQIDDYISKQLITMKEMMYKVINCCKKYSEHPDYIIKEYMDIGHEIDNIFAESVWWYSEERNPVLDDIYNKIVDLYNEVAQLLPISTYSVQEKEKYYQKLKEFYSDEEFYSIYRYKYFTDTEKVYEYQKCIEKLILEKETRDFADSLDIENFSFFESGLYNSLAEDYLEMGEYEKAIETYQQSYKDGQEIYEFAMENIADVYLKMGEKKEAIKYYEKAIAFNETSENGDEECGNYQAYLCIKLIKQLIDLNEQDKAKFYALKLNNCKKADIKKENAVDEFKYILASSYYLYILEKDREEKNNLWNECIKYYNMLRDDEFDDNIFEFILEYIDKEDIQFEEIISILDKIESLYYIDMKENIIINFIQKNCKTKNFEKYHVLLLIEYAKLFNDFQNERLHDAKQKCEEAQILYSEYKIDDEYIQNLIYKVKAELLSNDSESDFNQITEIMKQCNYILLVERELESVAEIEKKIELWNKAAHEYKYIKNYDKQIYCLEKSLNIVMPTLNQYEIGQLDNNYCHIMGDLIEAYTEKNNAEKAEQMTDELYAYIIQNYLNVENLRSEKDKIQKMKEIAHYYSVNSVKRKVVIVYIIALYISLKKDIYHSELISMHINDTDINKISRDIQLMLDEKDDYPIVDLLIDLKDKLIEYRDNYEGDLIIYDEIILKITENYQNHEIEFKK